MGVVNLCKFAPPRFDRKVYSETWEYSTVTIQCSLALRTAALYAYFLELDSKVEVQIRLISNAVGRYGRSRFIVILLLGILLAATVSRVAILILHVRVTPVS